MVSNVKRVHLLIILTVQDVQCVQWGYQAIFKIKILFIYCVQLSYIDHCHRMQSALKKIMEEQFIKNYRKLLWLQSLAQEFLNCRLIGLGECAREVTPHALFLVFFP